MAAAMKEQKTGLLELRVTVDRWIRVLATLTEDTLTVNPGEVPEEPAVAKPGPAAGAINGDPPNLSSSPVPETITNVKRTVRVTKQEVGGLGISIKGKSSGNVELLSVRTSFFFFCRGVVEHFVSRTLVGNKKKKIKQPTTCQSTIVRLCVKLGSRHETNSTFVHRNYTWSFNSVLVHAGRKMTAQAVPGLSGETFGDGN